MELRQLECFIACHEHGTFTAAARSLHMVQSAVSASVAKLEREVGTRLFDRTPTVLRLTPAGEAALEPARLALTARQRVQDAITTAKGEVTGTVVVGALVNVHGFDLAHAFAEVHRIHPRVAIAMRQNPRGSVGNTQGLVNGELDLALVAAHNVDSRITYEELLAEPFVLVTASDHPLAGGAFTTRDLAAERFIDFPPGWGTRTQIDTAIPHRDSVIEVADQGFAIQLAAKGFGVTLVPRSVAESIPGTAIAHWHADPLIWRMGVAWRAALTPSAATRAVIDSLLALHDR
ncbi:LysR family transcriptional regulator [Tsukamurella sp. 8F]|uniref:LysR family transcriptional regulator n=1 Tax=unclassified Tsukamurella TaxID=2633480 RepID=UPI0023B9D2F8|nr:MULTISPECIES: LysR family transcriptional regulator [unclassified Tsukamurella]MDF0531488.1 LysR family transcriptional regulator [Tsukamurella sp. 8J]MDF0588732.1 LysR family transcriptional regulator [Tsukamurella sp. 8F]